MSIHHAKNVLAVVAGLAVPALAAQSTTRVSLDSSGNEADADSFRASISLDGRYVVFDSLASNLVAGDGNAAFDVFVRDVSNGTTRCVSVDSSGIPGNQDSGISFLSEISADGRYVTFDSAASNLVLGDTNGWLDVFVRDLQTATTTRVSVDSSGSQGNQASSAPVISSDGRYIAFSSLADDLVPGDSNAVEDVFVHELQSGTLTRVSLDSSGNQASGGASRVPSLSYDGRYVAFISEATDLVAGDTNGINDVFVHDRATGATTRVSQASSGAQANNACVFARISGDARFVAFNSYASNLVTGDTNSVLDVFVHERGTALTTRASVDSVGAQSNAASAVPRLSLDGRYVTFRSYATNLVAGDTNGTWDVFVHDRSTAITTRASVASSGVEGDDESQTPSISADGRYVAFASASTNLVSGDGNDAFDIFVRERGAASATSYCTAGTTTQGCVPWISHVGTPSASASSGFTITVIELEGQKIGLVFYGLSGANALPWGSGSTSFLCVKAPTQRTPLLVSSGTVGACDGVLALDLLAFLAASPGALGQPIAAGQRFDAQVWFRDPPAPKTTNLSNALEFDLVP